MISKIPSTVTYDGKVWNVVEIDSRAFAYCNDLVNVTLPEGLLVIGEYAFIGTKISNLILPESIFAIYNGAFNYCKSLKEITIPAGVEKIEESTFVGCQALESLTIETGVVAIVEMAFSKCSSLKKVVIPTGAKEIEAKAFNGNSVLDTLIIASEKVKLGREAFGKCDSIKAVYILSDSVPDVSELTSLSRPFATGSKRAPATRGTLYVPIGCPLSLV